MVVFVIIFLILVWLALVTNTIFLLQPEKKKSLGFGKILKKKEPSNQPSEKKDHDRIAREPQYLSAAKRYKPLIKIYMNILNVAFQDTTPKYIEKVLVKEVSILFSNDQISNYKWSIVQIHACFFIDWKLKGVIKEFWQGLS